jgi:hypothetical protein
MWLPKTTDALRRNLKQAPIEGLARHGVMQNLPNKPEVMLRNDDLLILAAAMSWYLWDTSLAATRGSYSPSQKD